MHTNKLLLMGTLHFVVMFFLMYSMVYTFDHVFLNINKVYMAAIMTAPMLILEIWLMGSMYENKKALMAIASISTLALILVFVFIRQQAFVKDNAFLRSMIPHHSSAILMCEEADISDQEIEKLCGEIVKNQREEINQMKDILNRLNN